MQPGTFSFRLNIPVELEDGRKVNIPIDTVIMPKDSKPGDFPLLIEAKSAGDFTNTNKRRKEERTKTEETKYNLIVCNPPYVRHHHLQKAEKQRLQDLGKQRTGIKLTTRAGLYCHFLTTAHSWMAENALAVWLIPGEFMDVNYGKQIKEYLLNKVTLLRIHRFDPNDLQFDDALVSSAIVCFINKRDDTTREVDFSYGGTLNKPATSYIVSRDILTNTNKWTMLPLATSNLLIKDKKDFAVEGKERIVNITNLKYLKVFQM